MVILPTSRLGAFAVLNKFKWDFDSMMNFSHFEFVYNLKGRSPSDNMIVRIEQLYIEDGTERSANLYIVFDGRTNSNRKDVMTLLTDFVIPMKLSAHEVPCRIRRIAVDIDIDDASLIDKYGDCPTIADIIISAFMVVFGLLGHTPTYVVSTRHRADKKSYHVIFSGVKADTSTQKDIFKRVQIELAQTQEGSDALPALDDIYGKRSFAMTGSFKNGRQLIPFVTTDTTDNMDTTTTAFDTQDTQDPKTPKARDYSKYMLNMTTADDIDISDSCGEHTHTTARKTVATVSIPEDAIRQAVRSAVLGNYEVQTGTNGTYPLLRIEPFECIVCHRIHGKPTQCYLSANKENGVSVRCWRQPANTAGISVMTARAFDKFKPTPATPATEETEDSEADTADTTDPEEADDTPAVEASPPKPEKPHTRLQRYLQYQEEFPAFYESSKFMTPVATDRMSVIEYNEPAVREYPSSGDVFVRAIMGLGKTEAVKLTLRTAIETLANAVEQGLSVLIVSFRKTLGADFMRSFQEFGVESYEDIKGDIYTRKHARLVVQVESIHRIQNPYDIVMFDESESICDQLFASTVKKGRLVHQTLEMLLTHSKRVIAMDANLTSRSMDYINKFRPADTSSTFIHNTRTRAEQFADRGKAPPVNHYTTSQTLVQASILARLDEGKKVVVAMTNSKEKVIALYDALCKKYPEKKIKCYNALTDAKVKKEDFSNTATAWADLDCLIYSPTLQAGVSFTEANFDCFFGIFSARTCNVGSARQMIHRVRNFSISDYYICLTGRANTTQAQTSEADYAQHLLSQSEQVQNLPDGIQVKKAPTGRYYVDQSPLFDLLVQTRVRDGYDSSHFISEFLKQEFNSGVEGRYMTIDSLSPHGEESRAIKDNLYAVVGFVPLGGKPPMTPTRVEGVAREPPPEWKQLMAFISDNAERLNQLDDSVKPILRQYAKVAEELAEAEQAELLRAENPDSEALPEYTKTEFIRMQQMANKSKDMVLLGRTAVIGWETAEVLRAKIEREESLTTEERAQLRVYMLSSFYHGQYKHIPVEPESEGAPLKNVSWLENYGDTKVKGLYQNLCRLEGCYTTDDIEARCQSIELEEKLQHGGYLGTVNTSADGVEGDEGRVSLTAHLMGLERLTYRKYRIGLDLLEALEIEDITAQQEWSREDLGLFLGMNHNYVKTNLKEIGNLFGYKSSRYKNSPDKANFIKVESGVINKVLSTMYGVSIKQKGKNRKDKDTFVLRHDWAEDFTLHTETDADQDYPLYVKTH